jgi:uncharacterized protein with HEPN domain
MPRRDLRSFITDAVQSCEIVIRHAGGIDVEAYNRDIVCRSVIERHFMIIGEALNQASRLQLDLRDRITGFAGIVAFRNLIAHGYFMIDPSTVLSIARDDVPVLLDQLRAFAATLPPPNSPTA